MGAVNRTAKTVIVLYVALLIVYGLALHHAKDPVIYFTVCLSVVTLGAKHYGFRRLSSVLFFTLLALVLVTFLFLGGLWLTNQLAPDLGVVEVDGDSYHTQDPTGMVVAGALVLFLTPLGLYLYSRNRQGVRHLEKWASVMLLVVTLLSFLSSHLIFT